MNNQKITIITASYNYENEIKEAIESVINQTYTNWELIIIDDGSKDNSIRVIKNFCNIDKRIKLFTHANNKNRGLAETLKLGLAHVTTDWIAFLEADDILAPNYLEKKIKIITQFPNVDFIFNDVEMFGNQKIINDYTRGRFRKVLPILNNLHFPTKLLTAFKKSENDNLIATFSAVMLKKQLLENINFNSPIKPYLDWYLWLQIASNNKCTFYYLNEKLTYWRMHKDSYIGTKIDEESKFLFEIKKSILLFRITNTFPLLIKLFVLLRKRIIRLHFNESKIIFLKRTYHSTLLSNIYSRKKTDKKIIYKILGIKISKKNKFKNKKRKFNIDKIKTTIKENIKSPSVKFISFDIFDTLLVRPCINPTDIFALIAEKVDKKYNIDFFNMRKNAENEIVNATIYDIYNAIQDNYNISEELKNTLLQAEIAAETQLLYVREDAKEFYDLAVQSNKKIIAISDMYLPSDVLLNILNAKGFSKIEKVFVSNEYQARKDDGKLFDYVIDEIGTNNIFHIGDNIISDYKMPISRGIKAVHYPKIIDILSNYNIALNNLLKNNCVTDSITANKNIFIGFILNNYWFNLSNNNSKLFNSLKDFTNLFLAPYLCYIAFLLQHNTIIQNSYKKIFFVARDGFLPNKIYNLLNNGRYIQGEYIYGSRVAYWTGTYSSIYDLIKQQQFCFSSNYTFEDFLNAYITDKKLNAYLKTIYSKNELKISIKDNLFQCLILLQKEDENFTKYYIQQKTLAKKYYENLFKNESSRIVVFDIGYSGSISLGLSKLAQKNIDKIYIHETSTNIFRDNKNQTYTYILKNGVESNKYSNLDLLLEECFSPLEGTCVGFSQNNDNVVPLLDKMMVSSQMKIAHKEINDCCEIFTKKLINLFGEYIEYLNITDINVLFDCTNNNLKNNPNEKNIFKDIVFSDTATLHKQISLKGKIKW